MVIVTDSGSTKADWVVIGDDGHQSRFTSTGINPVFHSESFIADLLQGTFNGKIQSEAVTAIFYYGAGCWDDVRKQTVARALQSYFRNAEIKVMHDLDGAARATCGDEPGIACIMGTGSNSCLFDGNTLTDNVTNLGYLLGDEGSGTHLGKYLIRAYFYREIPSDLMEILKPYFPDGKKGIVDKIYQGAYPNVYLASLSRIIAEHDDHSFMRKLVRQSFTAFLDRHVTKYQNYRELPIHFVGSVAFHFDGILAELLRKRSLNLGKIMRKPIDALVQFHLQHTA